MLQTLKTNLGQLQEDGALRVLNNKISSTITDAMEVVAGSANGIYGQMPYV